MGRGCGTTCRGMRRNVHRDVEGEGDDSRAKGCGQTEGCERTCRGIRSAGQTSPAGPVLLVWKQRCFPPLSLSHGVSKPKAWGVARAGPGGGSRLALPPPPWPGAEAPSTLPPARSVWGQCWTSRHWKSLASARSDAHCLKIVGSIITPAVNPRIYIYFQEKAHSLLMAQGKVRCSDLWTSSLRYHSASSRLWKGRT